ncbi:MAG TPA: hypothetical protein VM580_13945 [Labilithrix sp.]|nr:hypothetical protein [Labilithrix sp.]
MAEDGAPANTLKGRLADVYVRALVDGALQALSRRLGNRATIDDPLFGRASTLSSIDPLLEKAAARFRESQTTYRHIASTTGIDRDVSEGLLVTKTSSGTNEIPVAVVAERRRLREIDLRVYYVSHAPQRRTRLRRTDGETNVAVPQIVAHVLDAFRKGAIERVLAAFEETSRFVDPGGKTHAKRDGAMAAFLSNLGGRLDLVPDGASDDGRNCCVEAIVTRQRAFDDPEPALLTFERGDSGLLRELRLYYEP